MLSAIFKQHTQRHGQSVGMYPPLGAHATMGVYLNGVEEDPQDPHCQIPDGLVFFADGSRLGGSGGGAGGAGVAYFTENTWKGAAFALGSVHNSQEAEMEAVHEALKIAANVHQHGHRRILVYTDCKDVIDKLAGQAPPQSLASRVHRQADYLDNHRITVDLLWVKGHNLSLGNILADGLARRGSSLSLMVAGQGRPVAPHRVIVIDPWDMVARVGRAANELADKQADAQRLQDKEDREHLGRRDAFRQFLLKESRRECLPYDELEEGEVWEPSSATMSAGLEEEEPLVSDEEDV